MEDVFNEVHHVDVGTKRRSRRDPEQVAKVDEAIGRPWSLVFDGEARVVAGVEFGNWWKRVALVRLLDAQRQFIVDETSRSK